MSQTASDQCPTPSPTFKAQTYQIFAHRIREQFIIISLLGGLYGMLTILSIISAYALIRRSGRIQPTAIILCITILALLTSTTIYTVISILYYQSDFLGSFLISGETLWDYGMFIEFSDPIMPILGIPATEHLQACVSAATLTINVALGDAIVCWRACVVWHKNRVVRAVCGLFLLATSSLAVINTAQTCRPSQPFATADGPNSLNFPGTLFEGLPLGVAACVLSLSTNLLATLLVAYKAWESRRRLGGYLVAKIGGSQVEKLLALLVESGAMYSAIWAVVVAYQVGEHKYIYMNTVAGSVSESATGTRFLNLFGVIMNGVLVPAIAIYPTIIIVLVALDRSHMERGLTQHLESLPTPNLALTVNTTATITHENHLYRRSEVLVIDGQELRRGDILESGDASRRTSEERKGEGLSTAEPLWRMSKGYMGETCA